MIKPCVLEFFAQVIERTNEFRDAPLLMAWIGPIPFLFLYHSETIEVHTHTDKNRGRFKAAKDLPDSLH